MKIVELTDDNVEDYDGIIDEELLADIGREYHKGIIAKEKDSDDIKAGIFWELKNAELEDTDTVSEIIALLKGSVDVSGDLMKVYNEDIVRNSAELSYFEFPELDEERRSVFDKEKYKIAKVESRDIIISVGELAKLPYAKKKPPEYIKCIKEVTVRQFKAGVMTSVLHGRYGLLDDLPFLPMNWFDMELSSCVVTDNKINGFLLVRRERDDLYCVELLFAMQPDANMNLLNMMRYSIRAAIENLSPSDRIILRRHSKATEALVAKLFPEKKGDDVIRGTKEFVL